MYFFDDDIFGSLDRIYSDRATREVVIDNFGWIFDLWLLAGLVYNIKSIIYIGCITNYCSHNYTILKFENK